MKTFKTTSDSLSTSSHSSHPVFHYILRYNYYIFHQSLPFSSHLLSHIVDPRPLHRFRFKKKLGAARDVEERRKLLQFDTQGPVRYVNRNLIVHMSS